MTSGSGRNKHRSTGAPAGPDGSPRPCGVRWHESPRHLAAALGQAGPTRVRRVHLFQLPPGILGGLYAASFYDGEARLVHRCLTTYADPALLDWTLRPFREALASLRIPTVEGRVEIGRNAGQVLHYFLPGGEDSSSPARARARRAAAREAWLIGASDAPVALRRVQAEGTGLVLCASAGEQHFLIRLEDGGEDLLADLLVRLGLAEVEDLPPDAPLHRDILGEWQES